MTPALPYLHHKKLTQIGTSQTSWTLSIIINSPKYSIIHIACLLLEHTSHIATKVPVTCLRTTGTLEPYTLREKTQDMLYG